MIKVGFLGDSIRIGYAPIAKELLGDEYECFEPNENGCFAKYTLRQLIDYKDAMEGIDIIHWNNGLWDVTQGFDDGLFSLEEEYVDLMKRIASILLKRHKKVIFATTTPVNPKCGHLSNPEIDRYNALVVPELEKMGVIINDLNSVIAPEVEKYTADDFLHQTPSGSYKLAEKVVEVIREVAKQL